MKMSKEQQVTQLTDNMAKFIAHIAKKLPDDVIEKLTELREKEDSPLSKVIYDTMFKNQELAVKLNRPSCQDTGVLQFWVKCGTKFPLIDELEGLLKDAVVKATFEAPLRHNSVETFDEYNTGKNVGKGTPTVFWDIIPNSDKCEIYTYMAGILDHACNCIGISIPFFDHFLQIFLPVRCDPVILSEFPVRLLVITFQISGLYHAVKQRIQCSYL